MMSHICQIMQETVDGAGHKMIEITYYVNIEIRHLAFADETNTHPTSPLVTEHWSPALQRTGKFSMFILLVLINYIIFPNFLVMQGKSIFTSSITVNTDIVRDREVHEILHFV